MKVKDVMTVNVAAVGQDATLKQVAEAMVDRESPVFRSSTRSGMS